MSNRIFPNDPPQPQSPSTANEDSFLGGVIPEDTLRAGRGAVKRVEKLIADYPVAALGLALAVGVATGWMVKRW